MCLRVLFSISIEDNDLFKKILDLFPKTPSQFDLDILLELLDKLRSFAQIEDFKYVIEVAKREALILNNQKIYSDI
jgi:hypothetical protein